MLCSPATRWLLVRPRASRPLVCLARAWRPCLPQAYWGVPYPFDTVKSKLQSDVRFQGRPMLDVARTIVREEGAVGSSIAQHS